MASPSPTSTPQLSVFPNPRVRWETALETDALLVAFKPAGVATQPGVKHSRDALLNGVFAKHGRQLQNVGKKRDFGLLHRLDRPTSGLVLIAKTQAAYDHLRAQFAAREIHKRYLTLVRGRPAKASGTIDAPIGEVRVNGRKRAKIGTHARAKAAVTRYRVIAQGRGVALLECTPETGRLHQIRAHCAWLGMPVLGDFDYGRKDAEDKAFARATRKAVFLHAAELGFTAPSGERHMARAPLPPALLDELGRRGLRCPERWC